MGSSTSSLDLGEMVVFIITFLDFQINIMTNYYSIFFIVTAEVAQLNMDISIPFILLVSVHIHKENITFWLNDGSINSGDAFFIEIIQFIKENNRTNNNSNNPNTCCYNIQRRIPGFDIKYKPNPFVHQHQHRNSYQ